VKWTGDRSEAFIADHQGRDLAVQAELALDGEGNFLALRCDSISNIGAHAVSWVPLTKGASLMTGVYSIPLVAVRARAVFTNTPPTVPYRSAGRPEAMFVIERLVDIAARQFGFDAVQLRRRNLVTPQQQPYANGLGIAYDNGDYAATMDAVLGMADWQGYAVRKAASVARGRLRGIGLANYIEITSGNPRERTDIRVRAAAVDRPADVEVVIGTLSSGQGHDTSFAQLVVQWLGVPIDAVQIITGDTAVVHEGGGSHSGRSMRLASNIIGKATQQIVQQALPLAAQLLEANAADVEFCLMQGWGRYRVQGSDRSIGLFDVACAAPQGSLSATCDETVQVGSYPYGAQVVEVEIDPETGATEIQRYAAIDDVGRAINPLILHGQTHGGIAQGIGQAMLEQCVYDAHSAQALSGSFMDYAMPRADHFPRFDTALSEVPASSNVHGVRSGGEGGTTPALAVFVNAVVDALADHGVTHLEMPVTPQRIWQALQK
jgi:carbon-monoxide dehydrogenase large subunit